MYTSSHFSLFLLCTLHHISHFVSPMYASPHFSLFLLCTLHHISHFVCPMYTSPHFSLFFLCRLHHISHCFSYVHFTTFLFVSPMYTSPHFSLFLLCTLHHISLFFLLCTLHHNFLEDVAQSKVGLFVTAEAEAIQTRIFVGTSVKTDVYRKSTKLPMS